ncbi:hypothetical protein TNCV_3723651 [Trichonephila clavipes]|nr:hypothetical protein TNCV_3723651 [Trichonephila clavipes]
MQELRNAISTEYIPDEKTIRKRLIDRSHDDIVISCFCASYKEATLYEASAAFATPPEIKPGSFAQFVHDNADFNINTMKCQYLHKSAEVFKNVNDDSNNIFQEGITCILELYGASIAFFHARFHKGIMTAVVEWFWSRIRDQRCFSLGVNSTPGADKDMLCRGAEVRLEL